METPICRISCSLRNSRLILGGLHRQVSSLIPRHSRFQACTPPMLRPWKRLQDTEPLKYLLSSRLLTYSPFSVASHVSTDILLLGPHLTSSTGPSPDRNLGTQLRLYYQNLGLPRGAFELLTSHFGVPADLGPWALYPPKNPPRSEEEPAGNVVDSNI